MLIPRLLILTVLSSGLGLASVANAMTVSPMQVEMTSAGKQSRAQVVVTNNSDNPLPIEASIQRMSLDETGRQKTTKSGEDFLIIPPQAMIPPGGTQNFRVQWLGDPATDRSESYVLFMNQVPVKMPAGKSGVQVVMSMGVMINVAPPEGSPALKVVDTSIVKANDGKRYPTVTIENISKVHGFLPKATINLASGSWSTSLTARDIGDKIGIGLVQPGHRRKFTLPVALPPNVSSVQASVAMNK